MTTAESNFQNAIGSMRVARTVIMARRKLRLATITSTCTRACSHCCYWPKAISLLEAGHIYHDIKSRHVWTSTLKDKLVQTANRVTGLSFDVWMYAQIPCAFLTSGNLCSIYNVRPFVCRSMVSYGNPANCQPAQYLLANTVPFQEDLEKFQLEEKKILARYGVKYSTVPLPTAILIAARIGAGEFNLDQAQTAILLEHMGRL